MPASVKRAVRRTLLSHLAALAAFLAFVLLLRLDTRMQRLLLGECPFRSLLHIYCPGCGGCRAALALLGGNPVTAFLYYPTLLVALLLLLFIDGCVLTAVLKKSAAPLTRIKWQLFLSIPVTAACCAVLRTVLAYTVGFDPLGNLTPILS